MYTAEIVNGVDFYGIYTDKFPTVSLCVLLRTPIKRETVTGNAMVAKGILNGCKDYKSRKLIECKLEEINTSISANILKKGEEHIIELMCKTTDTYVEDAVEILGKILLEPEFNNMDTVILETENAINLSINNKRTYTLEKCIETMCEKEPYGINGDGYIEDIRNVDIHTHYSNTINNSKVDIIAIGNTDPNEIKDYVKKYIQVKPRNIVLDPCNYMYYPPEPKNITESMDITQGKLCIGIRLNINPVGSNWYKAIVANELFGGSASSALFMEARESQSLCYYISSKLLRFKSIMLIEAGIDSENKNKVIEIVEKAFKNISDDNIEIAKNNIITGYKMSQDKPERIMDNILGGLIAGCNKTINDAIKDIEKIDSIKGIFNDSIIDTIFMLKKEDIND